MARTKRTPDPQICSLGRTIEIIEVRYRKKAAARHMLIMEYIPIPELRVAGSRLLVVPPGGSVLLAM